MLRILIVEDEVMIAKHIEDVLLHNNYSIVGIAHDSESALDYIHSRSPQLVILDINIEGSKDGVEVAEVVREKYDIPIVFLTALSDVQTLERAKKVTPSAYIVKPFKPKDLISSIVIGLYNYDFRKQSKELSIQKVNTIASPAFSNKEYEVLLDIKEGLTNAQIAKKQFLSLSTIKFHSKNIYEKLDVKNRTSAIKKVMEL